MNHTSSPQVDSTALTPEQRLSALFANLVIQQTNMALMMLGKVPHPETGETFRDIQSAKLMIDQLEMLEAKTKGNLTKQENGLLKQSLTSLRMSFVEAVEEPTPDRGAAPDSRTSASTQAQSKADSGTIVAGASPASDQSAEEESRKKFTKRY